MEELTKSLTLTVEVLQVPPVTLTKPVQPEEFCPVPPLAVVIISPLQVPEAMVLK